MLEGIITFGILLLSVVVAIGYHRHTAHRHGQAQPILRLTNTLMVGLACWAVVVYVAWMLDLPLAVGTVKDGLMPEVHWLPPLTVAWAALGHAVIRSSKSRPGR